MLISNYCCFCRTNNSIAILALKYTSAFYNTEWLRQLYILILFIVTDTDDHYNDHYTMDSDLNSFVLLVHINWRIHQYYFHSMFSFSLPDRKYFWAIWDPNSLKAFRLSDVSTDSPGWKSNHENLQNWKKIKNILVLSCTGNSIFILPSIRKKKINHPEN